MPCCRTVLFGLLLLVASELPAFAAAGLSADALAKIGEAAGVIRDRALVPPKSEQAMTEDMLRAYCHFFDPYGDYLTGREMRAYRESGNADYFGVEMEIVKKNGRMLLYPFPGGLAEKHGIRSGDELIAVNGAPVYGQSIFVVGSTIRGEADSTVQLTVRRDSGLPRIFSLRREQTRYRSVHLRPFARADYIRISRFTGTTADSLQALLRETAVHDTPLLIDLRQNQGGNLRAALRCADFFLGPGRTILRLRTRAGSREIAASQPPETVRRVILLQDHVTASAAEVFIAALVDNDRALSLGETSYGKGLAQRFFPLGDGSALRLTFAELVSPKGNRFNGEGLPPGRVLPDVLSATDIIEISETFVLKILRIADTATN